MNYCVTNEILAKGVNVRYAVAAVYVCKSYFC